MRLLLALTLLTLTPSLPAAVFRTSYVSFELPDHWKCSPEGTEWVCRSASKDEQKEAIIILTGKEAGAADTLENFTNSLRSPRSTAGRGNTILTSQVHYTKPVKINDVTWVDSLHISSELANFYTRYLVTVKSGIAILITFSAHQSVYTKYVSDFFNAVASLRPLDAPLPSRQAGTSFDGVYGPATGDLGGDIGMGYDNPAQKGSSGKSLLVLIGIVLFGVGAYLWMNSKKKR